MKIQGSFGFSPGVSLACVSLVFLAEYDVNTFSCSDAFCLLCKYFN